MTKEGIFSSFTEEGKNESAYFLTKSDFYFLPFFLSDTHSMFTIRNVNPINIMLGFIAISCVFHAYFTVPTSNVNNINIFKAQKNSFFLFLERDAALYDMHKIDELFSTNIQNAQYAQRRLQFQPQYTSAQDKNSNIFNFYYNLQAKQKSRRPFFGLRDNA